MALPHVDISDDGLASEFIRENMNRISFRRDIERWMYWDGQRWVVDDGSLILSEIRSSCRNVAEKIGHSSSAQGLKSRRKVFDVERLARLDPRVQCGANLWDSDLWHLNTPQGLFDLRTGVLCGNDPALRITRVTRIAPSGECPLWYAFIERTTGGDKQLAGFLQRLVGSCLTGSTQDQRFFCLVGVGANGKSIFVRILLAILGPYATTAPMETFLASSLTRHPAELAALKGMRLVVASEVDRGSRFAEARLKTLTGGDDISARLMGENFSTFTPQSKIILIANSVPRLDVTNEAMRRRVCLIPFSTVIPEGERDGELFDKLLLELGGILRWAIEGCAAWRKIGLSPPASVTSFTLHQLVHMDPVGCFLSERCRIDLRARVTSADLYREFQNWTKSNNIPSITQNAFSRELTARSLTACRDAKARFVSGLSIKQASA